MSDSEDKTIPGTNKRPSRLPYRPFGRRAPDSRPISRPGPKRHLRSLPDPSSRRRRQLPPLGLLLLVALISFGLAFAASSLLQPPQSATTKPIIVTPSPAQPAQPALAPVDSLRPPTQEEAPSPASEPTPGAAPEASAQPRAIELLDRRHRPFVPKRVSDLKANPFGPARLARNAGYVLNFGKVSDLKRNPFL